MNKQSILKILDEQLEYMKENDYSSYDLCDITSQPYFLKMNQWSEGKSFGKFIQYPHHLLLKKNSSTLRKLFKIKKQDFAQSNAFIVRGLLRLYQTTGETKYLKEAQSLIDKILEQKSNGFNHACWGQPYHWFSKQIIPAYTPRTTVTSQVGKMFLDAFSVTTDSKYLTYAVDIGDFFLEEMPLSYNEKGKTCFTYTTIDDYQVHNPNMMASGFLAMLWHHSKQAKYLERALTAANFTFSEIQPNGSWYYFQLPENKPSKIDNYHTGYNIESALLLHKFAGKKFTWQDELQKGCEYYLKNLFDKSGIPCLTDKNKFPTDIQCCAQSIITLSFLSEMDTSNQQKAKELYKWTSNHMYDNGYYYYRIFKNGSVDKTDYIRWGDAWMFFAGSLLLNI